MKYTLKILASFIIVGLTYFITKSMTISIIAGILSQILFWIYNPERRYWRAFWYVLVAFAITNNWSIHFYKIITNGTVEVKFEDNIVVSIILGILMILLVILDYKERKKDNSDNNKYQIQGDDNIVLDDINESNITINKK